MKKLLAAGLVVVCGLVAWVLLQQQPGPVDLESGTTGTASPPQRAGVDSEIEAGATDPGRARLAAPASQPGGDPAGVEAPGSLLVRATWQGSDEPAAGARLQLGIPQEFAGSLQPISGQIGADGTWLATALPPGRVHVRAELGGVVWVQIASGERAEAELRIPRGFALEGRVVDPEDRPVPGAHVFVRDQNQLTAVLAALADPQGRFAFAAVPIHVGVTARAAGGLRSPLLTPAPDAQRNMRLVVKLSAGGADLSGRVECGRGKPVAGARVRVVVREKGSVPTRAPDGSFSRPVQQVETLTGNDGRFELLGLDPGTLPIEVTHPQHGSLQRDVTLVPGRRGEEVFDLGGLGALAGTVRDREGRPIPAATIGEWRVPDVADEAVCNRRGEYRIPGVAPGLRRFSVGARGFAWDTVSAEIVGGSTTRLDVVLERTPAIAGVVQDAAGRPIACTIALQPVDSTAGQQDGATDAHGRFAIPSPDAATWKLRITERGAVAPVWGLGGQAVAAGTQDLVVVIHDHERATASLAGRIVRADGEPLRYAYLTMQRDAWLPGAGLTEPADGSFRIGRLPPGEYTLVVHPREGGTTSVAFGPFALAPHERKDLGTLRLAAEDFGRIVVRARRSDDSPVGTVYLALKDPDGREVHLLAEAFTASGAEVRKGEYELEAHGEGVMPIRGRRVRIDAGKPTQVDLTFEPAVRVAVSYPSPRPETWQRHQKLSYRLERIGGEVLFEDTFVPKTDMGHERYPDLAVGAYALTFVADDGTRYEGRFEIRSLEPRQKVAVKVERVR